MLDDFGDRLAALCRLRGLRNKDVAASLGMDPSTTSLWLRGLGFPRDRADVVARLFDGMSLAEFYSHDLEALRADLVKLSEARAS